MRTIEINSKLQTERDSAYEVANMRFATAFFDLANQSLKSNSDNFLRPAEQKLGLHHERAKHELRDRAQAVENLVKPMREALQQSQQQISGLEKFRSEIYDGIKPHLEWMQNSQKSLAAEMQNLVNTLRRPKVHGRWDEMTRKRLVELSGMVKHCDFQEQVHIASDGGVVRPNMIVRRPNNREVAFDVKTHWIPISTQRKQKTTHSASSA
jgi:DNA recombination protein RmuC